MGMQNRPMLKGVMYNLIGVFLACLITVTGAQCPSAHRPLLVYADPGGNTLQYPPGYNGGAGAYPSTGMSVCQWLLVAPPHHQIKASFQQLRVESSFQCALSYVEIYNSRCETLNSDPESELLARLCHNTYQVFQSRGSCLLVKFRSGYTQRGEFSLRFYSVQSPPQTTSYWPHEGFPAWVTSTNPPSANSDSVKYGVIGGVVGSLFALLSCLCVVCRVCLSRHRSSSPRLVSTHPLSYTRPARPHAHLRRNSSSLFMTSSGASFPPPSSYAGRSGGEQFSHAETPPSYSSLEAEPRQATPSAPAEAEPRQAPPSSASEAPPSYGEVMRSYCAPKFEDDYK